MPPDLSFDELIRRVGAGDQQAAAQLVQDFEPVVRRVLRARLRDARARREFDSMDICQSVLAIFFVRVAAGQYDLKEPEELVKLLVTRSRNKLAEKMRRQHRQRRDSRRTVGGVEELAVAGQDPTPSSVVAAKELLYAYDGMRAKGLKAVSPLAVQMYMPNSPAAAVGRG